jgi:hypothetical protein
VNYLSLAKTAVEQIVPTLGVETLGRVAFVAGATQCGEIKTHSQRSNFASTVFKIVQTMSTVFVLLKLAQRPDSVISFTAAKVIGSVLIALQALPYLVQENNIVSKTVDLLTKAANIGLAVLFTKETFGKNAAFVVGTTLSVFNLSWIQTRR